MYTIGQISEMFNIPASTLRYYDKEGLFPDMKRTSGIRKFTDKDIEAIKVIECLKQSGLEIKDIRQFMAWTTQGAGTYQLRRELFERRKEAVAKEIEHLQKTLNMLEYKCWYYETAIADGSEDRIREMLPDKLPEDIQKLYDSSLGK